jgi:hypothetical protein
MHFVHPITQQDNRIGGVMVSVLAWSVVDRGFEPWLGQTKDFKTDICCCWEWVSDCCLTPIQHFFSYVMARTS